MATATATATTTPMNVQKPEPAVIRQDTAPVSSPSRGFFPLRRNSQHGNNAKPSSNLGEQKAIPSSPPIANRRGSAIITNTVNRMSQSWFTEVGSEINSGLRDTTDLRGLEWDLEKGVKLEDMQAAQVKKEGRRKSLIGVGGPPGEQQAVDAQSSSSRPSTLNGDEEEEEEDDWNHEHPCFPHPNPHVPLESPLYQSTRIIRIPRDYMINGDNTPAFSVVYPVILEPYVTEEQFRSIVDTINEKLRLAFDPWNRWNWADSVAGLVTFWLWEEIFPTYVKRMLGEAEKILEAWNAKLKEQGAVLIPLRRSAYITVSHDVRLGLL